MCAVAIPSILLSALNFGVSTYSKLLDFLDHDCAPFVHSLVHADWYFFTAVSLIQGLFMLLIVNFVASGAISGHHPRQNLRLVAALKKTKMDCIDSEFSELLNEEDAQNNHN